MLRYVLKRILLFIPTLIIISILGFGLSQCTPGDPVEYRIPGGGEQGNSISSLRAYEKVYRREAQKIGADQPPFYFSWQTQAIPDTFHKVLPIPHRENLRKLVNQSGNWPATQAYYRALRRAESRLITIDQVHSSDPLIESRATIQQLLLRHEAPVIGNKLDSLQAWARRDSILQADFLSTVTALQEAFTTWQEQPDRAKLMLPAFRWNGLQNQYHKWVSNLVRGDLGVSYIDDQPVSTIIGKALRWTLLINGFVIVFAYLIAIPLGVYSAVYTGSRFDRWISIGLFLLYSLPSFWVATLLTQFLATPDWIDVFPSMGVGEVAESAGWWELVRTRAYHLFLPVFCLTYGALAFLTRQVRAAMLEVLSSDYIRTARAKGLPERTVIWKHAFRNGLFPLITLFANVLPFAIAGSVVIEVIFQIPGMGKATIDAIRMDNWPVVYGILMLTAVCTILGILLADIMYAFADPRVSLTAQKKTSA